MDARRANSRPMPFKNELKDRGRTPLTSFNLVVVVYVSLIISGEHLVSKFWKVWMLTPMLTTFWEFPLLRA